MALAFELALAAAVEGGEVVDWLAGDDVDRAGVGGAAQGAAFGGLLFAFVASLLGASASDDAGLPGVAGGEGAWAGRGGHAGAGVGVGGGRAGVGIGSAALGGPPLSRCDISPRKRGEKFLLRGGCARLRGERFLLRGGCLRWRAEVVSGDGFAEGGGGVGDCCLGVGLCGGGGGGFCGGLGLRCGGGVDGGEEVGDVLVDPGFVALDVFGGAGEPTAQFGFVEGFARGPLVGLFGVFAAQQGGALFRRDAEPFLRLDHDDVGRAGLVFGALHVGRGEGVEAARDDVEGD